MAAVPTLLPRLATTPRWASPLRRPQTPKAALAPVRSSPATVMRHEVGLHGQQVTFLEAGADSGGPVVVLLHGLASSSSTWLPVLPLLGRDAHVIAPDLLGHGQSAKPGNGDYSLGAYAAGLRDLLVALDLDLDRVTLVGHSFGGGVAMQFAYQFPELTQRLVLVASGGLGPNVNLALRAASLPGTSTALQMLTGLTPRWLGRLAHHTVRRVPGVPSTDIDELAKAVASFADRGAREAFVHTVRSALTWSGQRLDGTERLYLLAEVPVLLVGGSDDSVIPVGHTAAAHERLPNSRLEIFDAAGHFPHSEQPRRFSALLTDFLATTSPARGDRESLRHQLKSTQGRDRRAGRIASVGPAGRAGPPEREIRVLSPGG